MIIFLALILLGSLWLIDEWYGRHWDKALFVAVELPQTSVFKGDRLSLKEKVFNQKRQPLPFLQLTIPLKDGLTLYDPKTQKNHPVNDLHQVFSLQENQVLEASFILEGDKRGIYQLDSIALRSRSLFFRTRFERDYSMKRQITVYPPLFTEEEVAAQFGEAIGETLAQHSLFEDPLQFRSLREYTTGDPLRKVNWKKTASRQALYVNQYEPTALRQLYFVLDLPSPYHYRLETAAETQLALLATYANTCTRNGWQLFVTSNACDSSGADLFTGAQPLSLFSLLEALAAIDLEKSRSNHELFAQLPVAAAASWVIISAVGAKTAENQQLAAQHTAGRGLWLTVRQKAEDNPLQSPMTEREWLIKP